MESVKFVRFEEDSIAYYVILNIDGVEHKRIPIRQNEEYSVCVSDSNSSEKVKIIFDKSLTDRFNSYIKQTHNKAIQDEINVLYNMFTSSNSTARSGTYLKKMVELKKLIKT